MTGATFRTSSTSVRYDGLAAQQKAAGGALSAKRGDTPSK
ncbi:DUF3008 family protein [Devosia sp.]